jgi:hypothetical protein
MTIQFRWAHPRDRKPTVQGHALKAANPCCHNHCLALLVLSIALPLVWASIAESADTPLSRRVVNENGDMAHLFLSVPADAQLRAEGQMGQTSISANSTTNMLYHGGPVMRNPVNYLIF